MAWRPHHIFCSHTGAKQGGSDVQDFLRNNRGINDGGDLPLEFMEDIYNRIVHNEIKMKVSTASVPHTCLHLHDDGALCELHVGSFFVGVVRS